VTITPNIKIVGKVEMNVNEGGMVCGTHSALHGTKCYKVTYRCYMKETGELKDGDFVS
jgi:hypothetical protein